MSLFSELLSNSGISSSAKNTQINIAFSSSIEKKIIQQAISDQATAQGVTKAAVATNILSRALIPIDSENDAMIYESCLFDVASNSSTEYPTNTGIALALERAFGMLAAGVNLRPLHPCGLPYVQFSLEMARENRLRLHPYVASGEEPRVNLRRDYDDIISIISRNNGNVRFDTEAIIDSNDSPLAEPLFAIILDNWNYLKDYSVTFRYLLYLVTSTNNWPSTPSQRIRLKDVCATVASDYNTWRAQRDALNNKQRTETLLTSVQLADKDVVVVPRSWTLLNPEDFPHNKYVGVVSVNNVNDPDVIPFMIFSCIKPVFELNDDEEEAILRLATKHYPALSEIRDRQVELQYASDGGILNYTDYVNAPTIGLFPIPEESTVNESNPAPYGAVIRRG